MKKRWLAAALGIVLLWQQWGSLALASEVTEPVVIQQEADVAAEKNEAQKEDIQEVEPSEEDSEKEESLEEKDEDELQNKESNQNSVTEDEQQKDLYDMSIRQEVLVDDINDSLNNGVENIETTGQISEEAVVENQMLGNINWSISNGTLTISGSGDMPNYNWIKTDVFNGTGYSTAPWEDESSKIKKIVVGRGITKIGDYAFAGCTSLNAVSISSSVTGLGNNMFLNCSCLILYFIVLYC